MANEPGQAVLTILDKLIERIKSSRAVGTDNNPIEKGFVYSQLVQGQLVDPADFADPWSPAGGSTVHDAVSSGSISASVGAGVATPDAAAVKRDADAAVAKARRALQAAFNTSQLVDRLIMVTNDENFRTYPGGGRTISFAYDGIINGMQPLPAPPPSPEVQKRVDEAKKVLFQFDADGEIAGKSRLYATYVKNGKDYAQAKLNFALAQAEAAANPAKLDAFPMMAVALQTEVDQAFDTLKTEGAEKVEAALGVIESVGVSVQDRMIAKARKLLDAWSLNLAGVPTQTPYSAVSPSSWADPDSDKSGWFHLKVEESDVQSHVATNSHFFQQSSGHTEHSETSGGGGGSYFGFGGSVSSSSATTNGSSQASAEGGSALTFSNDARGLSIELEYGLCDILRPWLMADLFYMKNWFMVNSPKHAISDGTIEGQANSDKTLMPMLPMQFLVVRNVRIQAKEWGNDGQVLEHHFGSERRADSSRESSFSAAAQAGFGPFSFEASVDHRDGSTDRSQSSGSSNSGQTDFQAHFKDGVLEIKGAQIVAWLSTIVPACPLLEDPGLSAKPEPSPSKPAAPPEVSPSPSP